MSTPRIIPLTAVAIVGVLAINAITHGPDLLSAAKAFAEDAGAPKPAAKPAVPPNASITAPASAAASAAAKPATACAPTAAELAKEAGLSPAELQVLQSLGNRRGELDQRESALDTQVQLIAAAEAKLDARIQEMNGLKGDIEHLLGQADEQQQAETGRLVRVYEAMAPKDAAPRLAQMQDSVRLPIAAKMKDRALAAILGKMDPQAARILTEQLAHRVGAAQSVANARSALNPPASAPTPTQVAQASPSLTTAASPGASPSAPSAAAGDSAPPKPAARPHRLAKAKPRPKPAGPQLAAAAAPSNPTLATPSKPAPTPPPPAPTTTAPAPSAAPPAKTG
jgi:flagellar motility protein MotE (MotC chaperone)